MKIRPAPDAGIVGPDALREAFTGDYQQLIEILRGALQTLWKLAGADEAWVCVRAVYPDSLIAERDGKLWRYPYTIDDRNQVAFSAPVEVVATYTPVAGAMRESFADAAVFLEAAGEKKRGRFNVRVIRAGVSKNRNYYSDAFLRETAPLLEGARVFVKGDKEHLAGAGRDFRNLVGGLTAPRFVEGAAADQGQVLAVLQLLEPEGEIGTKLYEAVDRKMTDLFGLSIDIAATTREKIAGGAKLREAVKPLRVDSVDIIVQPGAGGQIINFIEAQGEDPDMKLRDRMLNTIRDKRPALLKDVNVEELDDDKLEGLYREALAEPAAGDDTLEQTREIVRQSEARAYLREALAESTLPAAAKAKLKKDFDARAKFTEAEIDQAIKDEREYVARFTESGRVQGLGEIQVEGGETRAQKVATMLDAFFDPQHKDHRHARSFKECYIQITGDRRVTGLFRECDEALLRESLGASSLDDVLGNSITRRMLADYRTPNQYDVWRPVANIVPVNDFRTQERTRFGGYGDLPAVTEGQPYGALTSPTDEKATYAATKRGGTEDVTLEMIKNDDVGVIRRIPMKLSRAAKRTLAKFVLDFIRTNPTVYDSVALFHNDHGNLGAAALDTTSLAAGRLAMLKQTELSSSDRIGVGPKSLLVPVDLQEAGVNLFNRSTNLDKTFLQANALEILPVWYWTDANDWALAADKDDVPSIEVGFMDGNEEPELFVQDSPTGGSMFSHDKLTWKIRHIYGGNVTDYRGLYKAVVT